MPSALRFLLCFEAQQTHPSTLNIARDHGDHRSFPKRYTLTPATSAVESDSYSPSHELEQALSHLRRAYDLGRYMAPRTCPSCFRSSLEQKTPRLDSRVPSVHHGTHRRACAIHVGPKWSDTSLSRRSALAIIPHSTEAPGRGQGGRFTTAVRNYRQKRKAASNKGLLQICCIAVYT